ncbi:hypothetical protein KUTeg_007779 [Tegillarca granosa]|uniref:DNA helicase B winged helix domain-containing protein n=1 Tax=Tegillarca granosa TaxID=220873 RepID=A0ABQ9FEA8_TEGGR|nr:hypothetical protein KUTeg_007779 [Tegillarca granosa]
MPPQKRSEEQFIDPKTGVFTDLDPGDYDDDDEEEQDDDIQFLDYREINGMGMGKSLVKSRRSKKQRGWLINPLVTSRADGKDKVQACAPFHFTDPWWKITMLRTTKGRNYTVYLKDMFALSYELRQDVNCSKHKVVSMFLTKQSEDDYSIHECLTAFEIYLKQTGQTESLTFNNVEDILKRFERSLAETEKYKAIKLLGIFYSTAGRHIYLAKTYPRIFEFIPQLLPNQFLAILNVDEEIIEELNNDLVERPWIFGFKQALYAERDLIGCEAPWIALIRAGFRDKIKNPYRDALIIYDYLKEDSKRNGHTCRELEQLKNIMSSKGLTDFKKALSWMKRKRVVKESDIFGKPCVFLYDLYKCEENISRGIKSLFLQPGGEELELKVNLQSEVFSSIRTDQ